MPKYMEIITRLVVPLLNQVCQTTMAQRQALMPDLLFQKHSAARHLYVRPVVLSLQTGSRSVKHRERDSGTDPLLQSSSQLSAALLPVALLAAPSNLAARASATASCASAHTQADAPPLGNAAPSPREQDLMLIFFYSTLGTHALDVLMILSCIAMMSVITPTRKLSAQHCLPARPMRCPLSILHSAQSSFLGLVPLRLLQRREGQAAPVPCLPMRHVALPVSKLWGMLPPFVLLTPLQAFLSTLYKTVLLSPSRSFVSHSAPNSPSGSGPTARFKGPVSA